MTNVNLPHWPPVVANKFEVSLISKFIRYKILAVVDERYATFSDFTVCFCPIKVWMGFCKCPCVSDRPCVAQWLERPLGVREAGVRFATASHQRRKNWEVCASQLGAWHQWIRQPTGRLGVRINGLSDSSLLTCGGIESVAWHPKNVGRRSFGPKKTGPHQITTHTPAYTTKSNLQSVIWPWVVESRL